VEVAKKSINDPKEAKRFVSEFLGNEDQTYEDFLSLTVPSILKNYIGEFAKEEIKEKQREEDKMNQQLSNLDKNTYVENIDHSRLITRNISTSTNEKTPNFMAKLSEDSKKIVGEVTTNGETSTEFFNKVEPVKEKLEFITNFDKIVF